MTDQLKVSYRTVVLFDRQRYEDAGGPAAWLVMTPSEWSALPWQDREYVPSLALSNADRLADLTRQGNVLQNWAANHEQPVSDVVISIRPEPDPDPVWAPLYSEDTTVYYSRTSTGLELETAPVMITLPAIADGEFWAIFGFGSSTTGPGGTDSTIHHPLPDGWTYSTPLSLDADGPGLPDRWELFRIKQPGDADSVELTLVDNDGQWTGIINAAGFANADPLAVTGYLQPSFPGAWFSFGDAGVYLDRDADVFAVVVQQSDVPGEPLAGDDWHVVEHFTSTPPGWRTDVYVRPDAGPNGQPSINWPVASFQASLPMVNAAGWAVGVPHIQRVPGTPLAPVVKPSNSMLEAQVLAPSDGGSPITLYTWEYAPEPDYSSWTLGEASFKLGTPEAFITGLDNGTSYKIRVKATNAIGDSGYSPPSDPATPVA